MCIIVPIIKPNKPVKYAIEIYPFAGTVRDAAQF